MRRIGARRCLVDEGRWAVQCHAHSQSWMPRPQRHASVALPDSLLSNLSLQRFTEAINRTCTSGLNPTTVSRVAQVVCTCVFFKCMFCACPIPPAPLSRKHTMCGAQRAGDQSDNPLHPLRFSFSRLKVSFSHFCRPVLSFFLPAFLFLCNISSLSPISLVLPFCPS